MKFNKKHGIILIIGLIIILIIIGLILYLNKKPRPANIGNSYKFNGEEIELPNTVNYKNEKLSSKHCLKDICIDFFGNSLMQIFSEICLIKVLLKRTNYSIIRFSSQR